MATWRLIAHSEHSRAAVVEMKRRSRIAIGWNKLGDLSKARISGAADIARLASKAYPGWNNFHVGPSLWNFFHHMKEGDLVILNSDIRRECVVEVAGPYIYEKGRRRILEYGHQRPAILTSIDPEDLWSKAGSGVAEGQNVRWTLAACVESPRAKPAIYREGARYSVVSTAIERNPEARAKCIQHFGCKCFVCEFDFETAYGPLGAGYIHVHHKVEISTKEIEHEVDPRRDLVPLCPNCHAMVHKRRPAMSVEALKRKFRKNNPAKR